jgi:hypothetical protein
MDNACSLSSTESIVLFGFIMHPKVAVEGISRPQNFLFASLDLGAT